MPPLTGLKVIDLTRVLAGPFCGMLLGDMGADVIKVEEPNEGDDARMWAPFVGEWSAYFLGVNRSKRSLALDLKTPEGAATLQALIAQADVFIENFKPGSLDKLGFGVDAMRALNPRLVYCSISGYGRTGPRRHLTGYDPIIQAETGFMEINGIPEGPPVRTGIATTDYLAGLYAFSGILLALRERDRTRPRTACGHRALRRDAVHAVDAGRYPAGRRTRADASRQRSFVDRALRNAPRERRSRDDRRGQRTSLETVVRGGRRRRISSTIRASRPTPIASRIGAS